MSQLEDRLQAAVRVLVAEGPLKPRLAQAYGEHLQALEHEELPEDLRPEFLRLREALHRHRPVTGQSAVAASVRKLSTRECEDLAGLIVMLLAATCRATPVAVGDRLKVVSGSAAESVPPAFLIDRR